MSKNENMNLIYKVNYEISINDVLIKEFNVSTRLKNKLINNKLVLLNDSFVDTRTIANIGDIITIVLNYDEDNSNIYPVKMNLDIIYEDEFLLLINKPSGIPVHPSILHFKDSLSNGIKFYFDSIGLNKKIRAVNRIDLGTSGLVLFAKNEYIQECLIKQMNNNLFKKTYLAIVEGKLSNKTGTISLPIARKENSIIERCISQLGQSAITEYKVQKEFDNYSLIECVLKTGRTHQIRIHMAHIGNPLLGDTLYNKNTNQTNLISRQALHSYKMDFIHPISKKHVEFISPIPNDFKNII